MTKLEISRELAARTGLPLADAIRATEGIVDVLKEAFAEGSSVYLRGFGTFKIVGRKQKAARDIRNGVRIMVPAHNTVKFIPSVSLKVKQ